ncbi:MAG: hypothetical protein JXA25_02350 [Anaerolineales bacterium]|nr:hypothetical protein [Anaerolineales bacterium]
MTTEPKRVPLGLNKPTLETRYQIDYEWWDKSGKELSVFLRSLLCDTHRELFEELSADTLVDHVDPVTAEIRQVPGIMHTLITHCSRQDDYITPQTSLVNAIFRLFIANGNASLSINEIGQELNRPASMILRMLSGSRVFHGIRPAGED